MMVAMAVLAVVMGTVEGLRRRRDSFHDVPRCSHEQ
jgi:hypothetical protein